PQLLLSNKQQRSADTVLDATGFQAIVDTTDAQRASSMLPLIANDVADTVKFRYPRFSVWQFGHFTRVLVCPVTEEARGAGAGLPSSGLLHHFFGCILRLNRGL
ncbi:MAG: hypothetical protein JSW12_13855, partial [Deltaproteobacteria bacterium]